MEPSSQPGASTAGPSSQSKSSSKASNSGGNGQNSRETKPSKESTQNRTRITVVCAECKRLKLKCDRKNPCGSCAKKNLTQCVYSQQATEKVDVQSLNNRVMLIEMALIRMSQGLPPNFVPTYPPIIEDALKENLAIPGLTSESGSSTVDQRLDSENLYTMDATSVKVSSVPHSHHHHIAAPASSTQFDPSIARMLLEQFTHLREGLAMLACEISEHDEHEEEGQCDCDTVKLEPDSPSSDDVEMYSPTSLDPHMWSRAQISLPAVGIYYSKTSGSDSSSTPKPEVTTALCNLLPNLDTCITFLNAARGTTVFRTMCLASTSAGHDWSSFVNYCARLLNSDSRSAGSTGSRKGKEPAHSSDYSPDSLPYFSLLCAALAVGASLSPSLPVKAEGSTVSHETPAFLLALSQQAGELWLRHGQRESGADASEATKAERADYFRSCLVHISFLLGNVDGQSMVRNAVSLGKVRETEKNVLLSTMSQVVSAVQSWSSEFAIYKSEGDESSGKSVEREVQESHKRLWWEFLNYDLLIAEALGKACLAPASFYNAVSLPSLDTDLINGDLQDTVDGSRVGAERLYSASLAGLTRLTYRVKAGITSPSCCCGYTVDQGLGFVTELKHWKKSIPPALSYAFENGVCVSSTAMAGVTGRDDSGMAEDRPSSRKAKAPASGSTRETHSRPERDLSSDDLLRRLMSCELAITAQTLLLKVYSPFVPLLVDMPSGSTTGSINQLKHAFGEFVDAAQATIRVARLTKNLTDNHSIPKAIPNPLPTLDQTVLDAVIACSRVCLPKSSKTLPSVASALGMTGRDQESFNLMQSIKMGLDLVEGLYGPTRMDNVKDLNVMVVKTLGKRWAERTNNFGALPGSLKRKHSTIIDPSEPLPAPRTSPGPSSLSDGEYEDEDDVVGNPPPTSVRSPRHESRSTSAKPGRNILAIHREQRGRKTKQASRRVPKQILRVRKPEKERTFPKHVMAPVPPLKHSAESETTSTEPYFQPYEDPRHVGAVGSSTDVGHSRSAPLSNSIPVPEDPYHSAMYRHELPSPERSRASSFSHVHPDGHSGMGVSPMTYLEPRPVVPVGSGVSLSHFSVSSLDKFVKSGPQLQDHSAMSKIYTAQMNPPFSAASSSGPSTPFSAAPYFEAPDYGYPQPSASSDNLMSHPYPTHNVSRESLMQVAHQPEHSIYGDPAHNLSNVSMGQGFDFDGAGPSHHGHGAIYMNDGAAYSSSSVVMNGHSSSHPPTPIYTTFDSAASATVDMGPPQHLSWHGTPPTANPLNDQPRNYWPSQPQQGWS